MSSQIDTSDLRAEMPVGRVRDVMNGPLLTCAPGTSVAEAARMMRAARCGSIVVAEGGVPQGIWTERDALRLDFSQPGTYDQPLGAVMTQPVKWILADRPVTEASVRFSREKIRHLVVIDEAGRAVGMLSQTDVVQSHGIEHYLTFREVRSVMSHPVVIVDAAMPLCQAAAKLRETEGQAAIVTSADWAEAGIVTERDILRMVAERRGGTAGDAVSRPVVSVTPSSTLLAARHLCSQYGFRHLAVREEDGTFVGLLSFSNLLSLLHYEYVLQLSSALRERDEALLRSRKDLYLARHVIDASHDGVVIVDGNGEIEYVNPAFVRVTGYTPEEAIGRNPRLLHSGRHDGEFYAEMWAQLNQSGHWQGEVWNRRKDGEIYAERLSINAIRDADGNVLKYAGIFSDITEKKREEERLFDLAYVDPLTNLPNRRVLLDHLGLAMANAHRDGFHLAVMFLDLDMFKQINDRLGHDAGDAVLVDVSERLRNCVREGDTVARLGGDEFVILLSKLIDDDDAARLAERVIAAFKRPLAVAGREISLTTSIGIAIYPDDSREAEGLLKCADMAMYQAKEKGRNGYRLYSAATNARSAERLAVEHRLREVIENRAMTVVYRVKTDIPGGPASAVEAQLRWVDPELGVVAPREFLPVAERLGLMPVLGEWLLLTACRQTRAWQERTGRPLRVTVNLSSRQCCDSALPPAIARVLAESGLSPQSLEMEMAEACLIDRYADLENAMAKLHELGVRVIVDDFSGGQATLAALRRVRVDGLKLDRQLVEDAEKGAEGGRDLLAAVVHLAHALGMAAVAERVEGRCQLELLRAADCDRIEIDVRPHALSVEEVENLLLAGVGV